MIVTPLLSFPIPGIQVVSDLIHAAGERRDLYVAFDSGEGALEEAEVGNSAQP
jgi:hypothetical protein